MSSFPLAASGLMTTGTGWEEDAGGKRGKRFGGVGGGEVGNNRWRRRMGKEEMDVVGRGGGGGKRVWPRPWERRERERRRWGVDGSTKVRVISLMGGEMRSTKMLGEYRRYRRVRLFAHARRVGSIFGAPLFALAPTILICWIHKLCDCCKVHGACRPCNHLYEDPQRSAAVCVTGENQSLLVLLSGDKFTHC